RRRDRLCARGGQGARSGAPTRRRQALAIGSLSVAGAALRAWPWTASSRALRGVVCVFPAACAVAVSGSQGTAIQRSALAAGCAVRPRSPRYLASPRLARLQDHWSGAAYGELSP